MAETEYLRLEIARKQLETAIWMFFEEKDRCSIITLAEIADVTFVEILRRKGKTQFAEYVQSMIEPTPSLAKVHSHIRKTLQVYAMKHFGENDEDTISLDLELCAQDAILKAMINLQEIIDIQSPTIKNMWQWLLGNSDLEKIMQDYNNRPERIRKFEMRKKNSQE